MQALLEKLMRREDLTREECRSAVRKIQEGAHEAQIGALLALLRAKGESVEELLGFAEELRAQAKPFPCTGSVLDIVGTGGDGAGTVNISTGSALLAARCRIPVVKHGNRAVSSQCGSADLLEALGFSFDASSLASSHFAFCFAPDYHPILSKVRAARIGLKIPTLFNLLGPLLNPAGTDHLMIGVHRPEYVELIAQTLFRLGTKRSLVFHGHGLDELSCLGACDAILVTEMGMEPMRIDPEKLGLQRCTLDDLKGGGAAENARKIGAALRGVSSLSDTLILNAGIGIYLYGAAAALEEGVEMARSAVRRKSLKEALRKNPPAVLAEIKRASPSKGRIGVIGQPEDRALLYVEAGAAAISVLTHPAFEGSLEDLRRVSQALLHTQAPVLRKDFLLEPIEIARAAAAGADSVLLIAAHLKERTAEMLSEAKQMGLEAIVEVHAEEDLAYIEGAEIIGVNQRDLTDFSMHPECFARLIASLSVEAVKLAESGIAEEEEAARIFELGYEAILVGEALTRSDNPQQWIQTRRVLCLSKSVV